jgi:sugar phosphate isomerase/epimerase
MNAVSLALSPMAHEPAPWSDAVTVLRDAGIEVLSGMMAMAGEDYSTLQSIALTGGVRPDATWPANLEHAREVAQIAARHRIGLVTFHAGFIPHVSSDHSRGQMLDRLGVLAELFAAAGVALALETGQETADTLVEALEDLNRGNIGVNFDPANMILYGMGDPIDSLRRLAPWVRQIHVKDALPARTPGTWGSEAPVGEGAVDWRRFFEVARTLPAGVSLVIEREAGATREADIAKARDLIEAALHSGRIT